MNITAPDNNPQKQITENRLALGISLFAAVAYFIYSFKANGFYQQDEAAHLLSMLSFWDDYWAILGNWAKPGYKILYVLPVLGGQKMVYALTCLFAGFSGYFAYKVAKTYQSNFALAASVLLLSQPFWVQLSFRNYSEIPSAFFVVLWLWLHRIGRLGWAGFVVGFVCTIRQEFYPIVAIYGLWLLYDRKWLPALAIAIAPILQHLAGWYHTGDSLYLLHQVVGQSKGLADAYPRQGFDHYLKTSIVSLGAASITLLLVFVGLYFSSANTIKQYRQTLFVSVPFVFYVLMQCLFNWQAVPIGPATGGNLRYMIIVAPLAALMAVFALDMIKTSQQKALTAGIMAVLALIVFLFMNKDHNFVLLSDMPDSKPLLGVVLISIAVLIPMAINVRLWSVLGVCILLMAINIKKIPLSGEDQTAAKLAKWYKNNPESFSGKSLYCNHSMFFYYMGKPASSFLPPAITIADSSAMLAAPAGSYIFWDSHYGYRPSTGRGVPYNFFLKHSEKFVLVSQDYISNDQSFGFLIFQAK